MHGKEEKAEPLNAEHRQRKTVVRERERAREECSIIGNIFGLKRAIE